MIEVTQQQIEDRKAAVRKRPTRDDCKKMPGYYERPAKVLRSGVGFVDGFEWGVKIKPNDGHGKLTNAGAESVEMMRPSMEADTERGLKLQSRIPRAKLVDQEGKVQFVPEAQADATAERNGWKHRWKPGGCEVERGWCEHGKAMLWRWVGEWLPTGVSCLGTPISGTARVARVGLQYDPGSEPWRYIDGSWRKL